MTKATYVLVRRIEIRWGRPCASERAETAPTTKQALRERSRNFGKVDAPSARWLL
jgi:hypothetical protein